ncbi:MAG: hypothetical protein NWF01_01535 [Candidatus Bathyarchaeota archaeon]|nr:hypothetical protein [Candidatus Bathyarchaeota archaeon]
MKDVLWGLVIPVLVGLLIIAFPAIFRPGLDGLFPPADMAAGTSAHPLAVITTILTHGFALIVVFAIPVVLGLLWNKWAGGAAGFIMGTLYYIAFAAYNNWENMLNFLPFTVSDGAINGAALNSYLPNLFNDSSFIGAYIIGGILIGYIAGALCNGSTNFLRMLGSGLTAALTVGIITFVLNYTVSYGAWMTQNNPGFALFTTMLPLILLGIIAPVISKVMTWYGITPTQKY